VDTGRERRPLATAAGAGGRQPREPAGAPTGARKSPAGLFRGMVAVSTTASHTGQAAGPDRARTRTHIQGGAPQAPVARWGPLTTSALMPAPGKARRSTPCGPAQLRNCGLRQPGRADPSPPAGSIARESRRLVPATGEELRRESVPTRACDGHTGRVSTTAIRSPVSSSRHRARLPMGKGVLWG
jgi:hypothetical protein